MTAASERDQIGHKAVAHDKPALTHCGDPSLTHSPICSHHHYDIILIVTIFLSVCMKIAPLDHPAWRSLAPLLGARGSLTAVYSSPGHLALVFHSRLLLLLPALADLSAAQIARLATASSQTATAPPSANSTTNTGNATSIPSSNTSSSLQAASNASVNIGNPSASDASAEIIIKDLPSAVISGEFVRMQTQLFFVAVTRAGEIFCLEVCR